MEKYRRVPNGTTIEDVFPNDANIVRVNVSGKLVNYITYAQEQLSTQGKVQLVGNGRAINRAVTVAEILRRSDPVHQLTTLRSVSVKDKYEPLEEGLRELEMHRTMSCISIVLAKDAVEAALDTSAPGYAPPLLDATPISDQTIAEMDNERAGGRSNNDDRKSRNRRDGRRRSGRRFRGNNGPAQPNKTAPAPTAEPTLQET